MNAPELTNIMIIGNEYAKNSVLLHEKWVRFHLSLSMAPTSATSPNSLQSLSQTTIQKYNSAFSDSIQGKIILKNCVSKCVN